jgi:hypothetical protein
VSPKYCPSKFECPSCNPKPCLSSNTLPVDASDFTVLTFGTVDPDPQGVPPKVASSTVCAVSYCSKCLKPALTKDVGLGIDALEPASKIRAGSHRISAAGGWCWQTSSLVGSDLLSGIDGKNIDFRDGADSYKRSAALYNSLSSCRYQCPGH